MIKGIIFDFDGLMVDTEASGYESWLEIFREHNCDLPLTKWALVMGGSGGEFDPCVYLEEQAGRTLERDVILARRIQRKAEMVADLPLLPGVLQYLDDARECGLKLAVASSSPHRWVDGHLARLGVLDRFDTTVCADDVERVKPAPDIFQKALERLGLQPHEAIVLEDSPNGLHAARSAGVFAIAIPNALTGQLPLDHADLRIVSMADVPLETLLATLEERMAKVQG